MAKGNTKSKHVLAVRMLVARTDWLDGRLRWTEGRVAWCGPHGAFVPGAADFARAQHCLTKIGQFPRAARAALGDSEAWLRQRTARLELAKRLRGLPTCELDCLTRAAGRGDSEAAAPLAALLIAESLCVNTLPASPGAALCALGGRAMSPLNDLRREAGLPHPARALASLVLGAIEGASVSPDARPEEADDDACLNRCRDWGRRHGLPEQAPLVAALLADPAGRGRTHRYLATRRTPSPFGPSPETLRIWLAEGVSVETVVALAEAADDAAPLARRVLRYRDGLPEQDRGVKTDRRAASEALRAQREEALGELASVFNDYAEATRNPAALRALTVVAQGLYALADATVWRAAAFAPLHETVLAVLRDGMTLEAAQQGPYLTLLAERQTALWDTAELATGAKAGPDVSRLRHLLQAHWKRNVAPIRVLLSACGDAGLVGRALDLGLARTLATRQWADPALFPFALALLEELGPEHEDCTFWRVWQALDAFSTARAARASFQPILRALEGRDRWRRQHFLDALLAATGYTRQAVRERLPRLTPFLRPLIAFVEADADAVCLCETVIGGALRLAEAAPAQAAARLEWLLGFVGEARRHGFTDAQDTSLEIGLSLGVALAAEDGDAFQTIVQTAAAHRFRQDRALIERSVSLLARFPSLRAPLAHLFPQQPQRCADLLVRLGLTTRLSTDVAALLAGLEPQGVEGAVASPITLCPHADWWRLHRTAPELTPTANAFLHAQRLLGEPPTVPPGVRRALDTPRRLAQELAYVERAVASPSATGDLSARAASLRRRLGDRAALAEEVRREAGDRLTRLAAQAQILAAERRTLACYRARLEDVAGPLPDALELDDDLINATLLTTDIGQNRRLLLRLIRAHLAGEHDWRERHPANAAFLAGLAAQGADADAWLAEHPRRYHCVGAPGKTVHLRLESDPLRILQMGNLFETCLSFGGINAFSTVANACELNKRVVYARDGFGRVVGRQLIGLNADGDLVGFHTYASLTGDADNQALRGILRQYVARFAARCRLRLSDTGTVPTLFAEGWYDDGLVGWEDGAADGPPPRRSRPAPTP